MTWVLVKVAFTIKTRIIQLLSWLSELHWSTVTLQIILATSLYQEIKFWIIPQSQLPPLVNCKRYVFLKSISCEDLKSLRFMSTFYHLTTSWVNTSGTPLGKADLTALNASRHPALSWLRALKFFMRCLIQILQSWELGLSALVHLGPWLRRWELGDSGSSVSCRPSMVKAQDK